MEVQRLHHHQTVTQIQSAVPSVSQSRFAWLPFRRSDKHKEHDSASFKKSDRREASLKQTPFCATLSITNWNFAFVMFCVTEPKSSSACMNSASTSVRSCWFFKRSSSSVSTSNHNAECPTLLCRPLPEALGGNANPHATTRLLSEVTWRFLVRFLHPFAGVVCVCQIQLPLGSDSAHFGGDCDHPTSAYLNDPTSLLL